MWKEVGGYLLIIGSTVFWLLAPLPWWAPGLAILNRLFAGLLLIALAELCFHTGLSLLSPAEAEHFQRWECLKRGFRRMMGD